MTVTTRWTPLLSWTVHWQWLIPTVVVCLVLAFASTALACPNCKQGLLENGQPGENLARGFELSIYLMLGTPLLILSGLGLLFYTQIRHAQVTASETDMGQANNSKVWIPPSNAAEAH